MRKNILSLFIFFIICFLVFALASFKKDLSGEMEETKWLYPVSVNGKFGYIDKTGEVKIDLRFDNAWDFSEGLACVVVVDKLGYIDETGKFVIEPKFDRAGDFSESLANVKIDNKWTYIDKSGKTVLAPPVDDCHQFTEGLALVKIGEKYGYIDKQGKIVIEPRFNNSDGFSEGMAMVNVDGKTAYIDKSGKVILEPKVDKCRNFHEGLAQAKLNGKWGFIDKNGSFVIAPQFDDAFPFNESLTAVKLGDKYGYIDRAGKAVISPQYYKVRGFFKGLAHVKVNKDDEWAYIDNTGKFIWKPIGTKALAPLVDVLMANALQPEPSGLYQLEQEIEFNVLDNVVLNPKTGQITLIGHFDERYFGPRIPYLQHLASLLENPKPEFSLRWTQESGYKVDELFRRMDSLDEIKRIAHEWGQVLDDNGDVTAAGRWLLPIWGVQPPKGVTGDPWARVDRYYIVIDMLNTAGKSQAALIVGIIGQTMRIPNPSQSDLNTALNDLIGITGNYELFVNLDNKLQSGQISQEEALPTLQRAICQGIDRAFELSDYPVTRAYDEALQSYGIQSALPSAFRELDRQIYIILGDTMESFFARYDQIQVPPEIIERTLGVHPEVVPEYSNIDPTSQLARVVFTSDYIGKHLINFPELKKKIAAYKTEFEFNRMNPRPGLDGATSDHHMWISVDKLMLAQSVDGFTMETRDVKMRFNIRERGESGKDLPPAAGGYEELLTSLYDDFAQEFPVFHELRECAKLTAAALWIRARKPDIKLPMTGRVPWHGPSRVSGVIYFTWSPRPIQDAVNVSMKVMGGISLVPPVGPGVPVGGPPLVDDIIPHDSSVVDMRSSDLVAVPEIYDNQVLKKMLRRKIDVPIPKLAGWVASATKGERIYKTVSALPVPEGFDTKEAFQIKSKLEEVKDLSFQLGTAERAINILNQQNIKSDLQLANLEKELKEAIKENFENVEDSAEALFFQLPGFLKEEGWLKNLGGTGELIDREVALQSPEKIEAAWKIFKELKQSSNFEHKINALEEVFKGVLKVTKAPDSLVGTISRANKVLDAAETANRIYKIVHNVSKVPILSAKVGRAVRGAEDYYSEINRLTIIQKELNDKLDNTLKDPVINQWLERGK